MSSDERQPLSLADKRQESVPEIVERLEGLLAQAKRGDLRGLSYSGLDADGMMFAGDVTGALTNGEMALFNLSTVLSGFRVLRTIDDGVRPGLPPGADEDDEDDDHE